MTLLLTLNEGGRIGDSGRILASKKICLPSMELVSCTGNQTVDHGQFVRLKLGGGSRGKNGKFELMCSLDDFAH